MPGYPQEQSDLHTAIPLPSAAIYPSGQSGGQADKIPIPTVSLKPSSSFGSDMADDAPAYVQAGIKQQTAILEKQTWAQAGIKDIKRQSSPGLLSLIIVLSLGLIVFVTYNFGLMQGPIDGIKGLISKIEMPSSIPFLSSLSDNSTGKDTTPPIISNIMVANITDNSAIIIWITDEAATSQVMFCEPEGLCCWTEADKKLVINHSVTVSNLKPGMTYHYTASSLDASENEAISEGELTTSGGTSPVPTAPTSPLLISGITVLNIGETSAKIEWETNVAAMGQVEYGETEAYGLTTPMEQQPATKHSATLSNLAPTTSYCFRLKVKDTSGNEATAESGRTFVTSSLPQGVSEGIENGMRAPNFTLQTIDGKNVSLTDYRGKLVMINFWGGGYQRSRNEMSVIQEVYNNWSGRGLVVLAVDFKETPAEVQKFIEEKHITFTVLLDPTSKVSKQYNVNGSNIPTTFFVDKNGIIKEIRNSAMNKGGIEAILESM